MARRHRPLYRKPPLSEELILSWADDHFERYGQWPTATKSGVVQANRNEKWSAVDMALRAGVRDLPGGSSLARLLAKKRNVRNKKGLPPVSVEKILQWADAYHARTGEWPNASSGPIPDSTPGETWLRIDVGIAHGCRGFAPGTSLAWILAEHRGVGEYYTRMQLSEAEILRWADRHYRRTGRWPTTGDEEIPETPGTTWKRVDSALRLGQRGLAGGSSLSQLLSDHRDVPNSHNLPPLTKQQILAWADAHYAATGLWPSENSGGIVGTNGETWLKVSEAMRMGRRGFAPGGSIAKLLESSGRKRNRSNLPIMTRAQILLWADEHFQRTGKWPNSKSGSVLSSPEESWANIDHSLQTGTRGLKGGSSLLKLLMRHRGIPDPTNPPHVSLKQIRKWAVEHHRQTGRWPQACSGRVMSETSITWSAVNDWLCNGRRGLPGGSTLSAALAGLRRSTIARQSA